ncbi:MULTISPECIES: hypothetical protein [Vibrio]|uniref:hypothetical protein n=1 Tax=Vibrio TaxID=662 RepID=UPI00045CADED|nr:MULTISPECIES: hypothetical protein [Vibrio]EGQ9823006.1 hypothetical protein [Vibrio parahaemolyticus]GAJ78873.1 hypothetical protein JCM18905_4877 [Vibrio sp. JCM 18905]ATC59401.1 hypothetical protein CMV05_18085 [Vibrio anguillarum]AVF95405.1 hypothetical protein AL552_17455 [Vibrio diabolicus]EHC9866303.1 hypothetical protein [Vibrio alginolyticus]
MSKFKKSDMKYNHYSWTAISGDDPKITGKPDSTLFSRKEGYEVLYMINKVLEHRGLSSVTSGQKAETLIKDSLPSTVRSQENVFNWLNNNW